MKKYRIVLLTLISIMAIAGCSSNKNFLKDGEKALENKDYTYAVNCFDDMIEATLKEEPKNEKENKIQDNNISEAYKGLGIAYFELEEYDKALNAYEEADKYEVTKTAVMYRNMAVCAEKIEEYDKAVIYGERGLESTLDKDSSEIRKDLYYVIIKSYEVQGNWEDAYNVALRYNEEFPGDADMEKDIVFLETR